MGILSWLFSKLRGVPAPPQPSRQDRTSAQQTVGDYSITVTISGPATREVAVSDEEVAEAAAAYAFVLSTDPAALKTAQEWWNEETHKRRRRDGSDKALAWLLPFVPLEIAMLPELQSLQDWAGPHSADGIAKALRALIRARRKAKEPYEDLLRALYGACVCAELANGLEFERTPARLMVQFVDLNDVRALKFDYGTLGC